MSLPVPTDGEKETLFQMKSLEALENIIDTIRRAIGKQKLWRHLMGGAWTRQGGEANETAQQVSECCCPACSLTSIPGTHMLKGNN